MWKHQPSDHLFQYCMFFFQFSCFCCWFWRLLACIHFPLPSVASTGPKLQPKTWPCACTRFTFIDQINCRAPTLANQTNSVCLSVSQMICYPLTHQCGVTAAVAAVVAAVAADHAGFHEIYGMFYGAPICNSADLYVQYIYFYIGNSVRVEQSKQAANSNFPFCYGYIYFLFLQSIRMHFIIETWTLLIKRYFHFQLHLNLIRSACYCGCCCWCVLVCGTAIWYNATFGVGDLAIRNQYISLHHFVEQNKIYIYKKRNTVCNMRIRR